ncbi:MAG: hypothetical protein WCW47_03180 [Candidatus Paceibacterota bacterium]|jgi:hypothetical protein
MGKQNKVQVEQELVDCAEALRKLHPEDPLEWMYQLITEGKAYLEWVKAHDPCNVSWIYALSQRIKRAEFFSLEKEMALNKVKAGGQKE